MKMVKALAEGRAVARTRGNLPRVEKAVYEVSATAGPRIQAREPWMLRRSSVVPLL